MGRLVHELRQSDLLSNAEASALQFLRLPRTPPRDSGWPAAASSSPISVQRVSALRTAHDPLLWRRAHDANRFSSVREAVAISGSPYAARQRRRRGAPRAARALRAAADLLRAVAAGWSALVTRNVPSKPVHCVAALRRRCSPPSRHAARTARSARSPTQPPKERLRRRSGGTRLLDALGTIFPTHPPVLPRRCRRQRRRQRVAPRRLPRCGGCVRRLPQLGEAPTRRQLLALHPTRRGSGGLVPSYITRRDRHRQLIKPSSEARRRLKSFAGSLALPMPAPPPVACMRSVSFAPVYAETVIFSLGELCAAGPDVASSSTCCRGCTLTVGRASAARAVLSSLGAADLLVAAPGVLQSVRFWASFEGRSRAPCAGSCNAAALRLRHPQTAQPRRRGRRGARLLEFDYVVCCQLLGAQRRRADAG